MTAMKESAGDGAPTAPPSPDGVPPADGSAGGSVADHGGAGEEATMTKKKGRSKKGKRVPDDEKEETNLEFTWICSECREAECLDSPDSRLVICDGRCNRPFHPPCANLLSLPPDDVPWVCGDCEAGRHQCAVCKEFGEDDVDVFCCDARGCGLFFHENCLEMYSVDVRIVEEEVAVVEKEEAEAGDGGAAAAVGDSEEAEGSIGADNGGAPATRVVSRPRFRCPAHECWTCSGGPPPMGGEGAQAAAEGEQQAEGGGEQDADEGKKKKGGGGNKRGRGKKRKSGGGSAALNSMWAAKKERLFVSNALVDEPVKS